MEINYKYTVGMQLARIRLHRADLWELGQTTCTKKATGFILKPCFSMRKCFDIDLSRRKLKFIARRYSPYKKIPAGAGNHYNNEKEGDNLTKQIGWFSLQVVRPSLFTEVQQ